MLRTETIGKAIEEAATEVGNADSVKFWNRLQDELQTRICDRRYKVFTLAITGGSGIFRFAGIKYYFYLRAGKTAYVETMNH